MVALPDVDTSRALLIGVHTYQSLDDLPAVRQNLAGLRQAFTDPVLWGLLHAHCTVLSQPSSRDHILDTLKRLAGEASDTLVVYFAGHGLIHPDNGELYLAMPDSDRELLYKALPFDWIRQVLLSPGSVAQRMVVILDCCFSGRALIGRMSADDGVAEGTVIEGTCVLTASAETRTALAPPGERFTAFTGELVTVLTEGLPNGPALLDMETLYRALRRSLAAKGRPVPQKRSRNTGGLVALARNRSYSVPIPQDIIEDAAPAPARPWPSNFVDPHPKTQPQEGSTPTSGEDEAQVSTHTTAAPQQENPSAQADQDGDAQASRKSSTAPDGQSDPPIRSPHNHTSNDSRRDSSDTQGNSSTASIAPSSRERMKSSVLGTSIFGVTSTVLFFMANSLTGVIVRNLWGNAGWLGWIGFILTLAPYSYIMRAFRHVALTEGLAAWYWVTAIFATGGFWFSVFRWWHFDFLEDLGNAIAHWYL